MNLRGLVRQDMMQLDDAMADFDAAISLGPDFAEAHVNRGLLLLLRGDCAHGFDELAWRTRVPGYADYANYPFGMPRWNGEDLAGKSLLVHAEQGMGDTLQFARFLAPLARSGAAIDVFCHPPLVGLVSRIEGVRRATSELAERPTQDFHAPLLDVAASQLRVTGSPRWFGPYVAALPERLARFDDLDRLRRNRSLPRDVAVRLVAGAATFVNVQLGEAPLDARMVDAAPRLADWDHTAAVVAKLDLLVTVDTAIAHLAGAMGKTVWVLLPFSPDWRWGWGMEDTAWYPGMRLFRQPRAGDWDGIVREVGSVASATA